MEAYNSRWNEIYKEEETLLRAKFGGKIIAIEHVGSTSISGALAKPIIDIAAGVRNLDLGKALINDFEQLGYEYRPFVPNVTFDDLKSQLLFAKGPDECRTHYLHMAEFGGSFWIDIIAFRDYLKNKPDLVKKYNELKLKLAHQFAGDRKSYTSGKNEFVKSTIIEAKKEEQLQQ